MRFMGPYLIRFYTEKNQTNLFHVMYGLANIDISSLMNLSQKLISISHRLFLTVFYNNKPKQRHWLEGKKNAVSVISKDSFPTLNTNRTLHDFFMTVRWNEKTLCSNYTKACIFYLPNIHPQNQDWRLLTWTLPVTNKRRCKLREISLFLTDKGLDIQPEILHYGLTYMAYLT